MISIENPNIEMIEAAAKGLGELVSEVVFLGGAATGLLLSDPAALPLRVTRDIDVIIEVFSLVEYHRFNEKLRKRGFFEDIRPEAPICRWQKDRIILDVMPTDPQILGFGNQWFSKAFYAAVPYVLPSSQKIKLLPAPYFLATKLEAFEHRGEGDFLLSTDMEDIIVILDGRPEIVDELHKTEIDLKNFIINRISKLLINRDFLDALPGHLPPDLASQARSKIILEQMNGICSLST